MRFAPERTASCSSGVNNQVVSVTCVRFAQWLLVHVGNALQLFALDRSGSPIGSGHRLLGRAWTPTTSTKASAPLKSSGLAV